MQQRYYRRKHMNFKEAYLKDGENAISPITIVSSIYTEEGNPYTKHTHDDRYYTESEINAMFVETGKTYTYTGAN